MNNSRNAQPRFDPAAAVEAAKKVWCFASRAHSASSSSTSHTHLNRQMCHAILRSARAPLPPLCLQRCHSQVTHSLVQAALTEVRDKFQSPEELARLDEIRCAPSASPSRREPRDPLCAAKLPNTSLCTLLPRSPRPELARRRGHPFNPHHRLSLPAATAAHRAAYAKTKETVDAQLSSALSAHISDMLDGRELLESSQARMLR